MINTILIPIITAYYVKNKNFYYENGLVDNIFLLSVSTILVPPILLLINPYRIFMGIVRCIKSLPSTSIFLLREQTEPKPKITQHPTRRDVILSWISIYLYGERFYVCLFLCFLTAYYISYCYGRLLVDVLDLKVFSL
jgi:hypothetical protein